MEERFEGRVVAESDCLAVSIAYISASLIASSLPMSHEDSCFQMQLTILAGRLMAWWFFGLSGYETGSECWRQSMANGLKRSAGKLVVSKTYFGLYSCCGRTSHTCRSILALTIRTISLSDGCLCCSGGVCSFTETGRVFCCLVPVCW